MATLQLRLDRNTKLGDLAKDIISGFETVLMYNKQPIQWGHRDRTKLIRMVRRRLSQSIAAYSPCGKKSRCTLASVPVTFDSNWAVKAPRFSEKILLIKEAVPQLCLQLEAQVFDRYYAGVDDAVWLPLKPELDRVVEETLKPLLYENSFCEGCALCTSETRRSPWSLKPSSSKRRHKIR
jgi:hypothetical protein